MAEASLAAQEFMHSMISLRLQAGCIIFTEWHCCDPEQHVNLPSGDPPQAAHTTYERCHHFIDSLMKNMTLLKKKLIENGSQELVSKNTYFF